ncbi:unnamed protein product, partial [Phaeothamnion confervicola]
GLDCDITRRDFVNSVAFGSGAALLGQCAPLFAATGSAATAPAAEESAAAAFNGYPGVGDYARSNGNTWQVVQAAHAMRDGAFKSAGDVTDTGETYDVVVVGGGFSGMGAAHRVMQLGEGRKTCLVIENHPMWGGEAKRNEFVVGGVHLDAPQGSNETSIPKASNTSEMAQVWRDVGLPSEATYSVLPQSRRQLAVSRSNYMYQLWGDNFESHGFWFPEVKRWVTNPWGHDLAGVPWSDAVKRDMLRWRHDPKPYYAGEKGKAFEQWLDSMSYEQYVTQVMGLGVEPARYADAIIAAAGGLGSDATSAYMTYGFGMPGFQALQDDHPAKDNYALAPLDAEIHRFPGGNDGVMRAIVKRLVPDSIAGSKDYADVHNGAVRFDALDKAGQQTRIRLGSLAVSVAHEGALDKAERISVTYLREGRLYKVRARGVVMASACWTAKHVVRDLPAAYQEAMGKFHRSPMLIVNVALNNWRALYKLGYTAASWRGGFGFSFNLSPPMQVGGYAPAFDPGAPAVLTYYVPFPKPGLPMEAQGVVARNEMLATPYREYERIVRAQLTEMLSGQGFDARRDIAGIILNRWGHAYVDPYPGFYFGRDGKPAPRDIVRTPLGRIAFGHSELLGHQYWNGGLAEGRRAAEQVLQRIG